jgi:PA14 domain
MTRKIRLLLGTLFILGLLLILSPNRAHADEVVVQVISDPAPSTDTATVTSVITIQSIETKIDSAIATLSSASQEKSNAIISTIQANVPNTDTQTAISIATTQEPIKTAVLSVTPKIESATATISAAQSAVQVVIAAQTNVDTQTATVAVAQSIVDSATVTTANAQTTLTSEVAKLPDLKDTQKTAESGFYTGNSNLGTATSNVQIAQNNLTNAVTDLQNNGTITTTTNGVTATVYRATNGAAPVIANQTPVEVITLPNIAANWGSGQILNSGLSDHVIVKYEGTITVPNEAIAVKYAVSSDDGSKMYIDGVLAINNWRDQGTNWSPYSPTYNTTIDKQQDFVIWYYENGGGASCTLGWMIFRSDGTGYFTTPGSSAFGTTTTTVDPVKLAAADAAKANVISTQSAYNTQLAVRDAAYQAWQDAIHAVDAQQSVIDSAQAAYNTAQQNLTIAQQNLTTEQQNLTTANQNFTIALQTADSLANNATTQVNEAVTAMTNAAQVTTNYYAEQQRIAAENARIAAEQAAAQAAQEKAAAEERAKIAAENAEKAEAARIAAEQAIVDAKAAQEKAAAEAKAAEEARVAAEQAAKEAQAAADKAAEDAKIQAAKDAQAAADAAKAEADAKAKAEQDAALAEQKVKDEAAKAAKEAANAKAEADKQKAEADRIAAEQAAKDQAAKDAKAQADAVKADQAAKDKATADAIGVKPNNPDQLSDTVVKEAPKEILIAHVQQDVKGVENGGIEFFGTKSAPQVVGEDGHLTPPAPPPGSGLPIPADAITTSDTFIGQPGGTSFNAPDVAVPVILTPVTGALASVPGIEAVNQAFVAMANIGNDMSPVTRKKAKKILVTTVVVGQIVALRRRFGK